MHAIHAHVETLVAHATPATTLLAVDAHRIRRFPDPLADDRADHPRNGTAIELARADQIALRLLERETRLALRHPDRDRYHAHHPAPPTADAPAAWAILLAPRAAAVRLYLSRADKRRFYRPQDPIAAPLAQPGTLLARWDAVSHAFTHITTDDQKHSVLFASTADHHIHIPFDAPGTAQAIPFSPTRDS